MVPVQQATRSDAKRLEAIKRSDAEAAEVQGHMTYLSGVVVHWSSSQDGQKLKKLKKFGVEECGGGEMEKKSREGFL